ncbi:hypothetical protein DBR47_14375 [Paucibacter sp. KBW04]|uniref:hypothetical protein n=1 Tax=Paucibacter sp. KBW04 TaxID=2153361 RepID=UPI000F576E85|nr:hypothetical protein [Paucibacter sp. KBW04]RQO57974.1 hypothetical protein DBR47_14375 [Paucibacter sp. KBW04]
MDKIKLVGPEGANSASVDGVQYDIGADGKFEVASQHALQLYGFGFGNAPADEPAAQEAPKGGKKAKAAEAAAEAPADEPAAQA